MSGSITDADAQKIGQAVAAALGVAVISIDSLQLYTALVTTRTIQPASSVTNGYIPPNTTLTVVTPVPANTVQIVDQLTLTVEQDHAFSLLIDWDNGYYTYTDNDVVQGSYITPIEFATNLGTFVPLRQRWKLQLTNKTDTYQYFAGVSFSANFPASVWDALEANFFAQIAKAIPGLVAGVPGQRRSV